MIMAGLSPCLMHAGYPCHVVSCPPAQYQLPCSVQQLIPLRDHYAKPIVFQPGAFATDVLPVGCITERAALHPRAVQACIYMKAGMDHKPRCTATRQLTSCHQERADPCKVAGPREPAAT